MNSPDLLMGLGSILYALSKIDGISQKEEVRTLHEILADEPEGDLALCGFFLREKFHYSAAEAYETGLHRMKGAGISLLSRERRKRFITILLRVARAHGGLSRTEWRFIRNFWRELLPSRVDGPKVNELIPVSPG